MTGVIVNTFAVILGSFLGLILKKGIPEKVSSAVMTGIGLCTVYIGLSGSLSGENVLIVICSMVIGSIIGTLLDVDGKINLLGKWVENRVSSNKKSNISQGFVTGSLFFCIGAMTIVGSLNAGLQGDNELLFTKSLLDFFSSIMFTTTLGIGIMFSAAFVLVFQGSIVLLATYIEPFLSTGAIEELTCAGSLMILALGLNILNITNIKVANYLPVLVCVPIVYKLVDLASQFIA